MTPRPLATASLIMPNPCSLCGLPISGGSFVGTGDGTLRDGGSFAHAWCYRAAEQIKALTVRAEQAEAALTTLRAQMRPTAEAAWDEWRQALPSAPQGFTHAHGVRYLQILARHFEALASQEGR